MKKTHKKITQKLLIPKEIITYLMDLADTLLEKDYYHTLSTQTYLSMISSTSSTLYLMRHIITSPLQLK